MKILNKKNEYGKTVVGTEFDQADNFEKSNFKSGTILKARQEIDNMFLISTEKLASVPKGSLLLVLSSYKNKKTNEEILSILYNESKYLFFFDVAEFDKHFTIEYKGKHEKKSSSHSEEI